MADCSKTLDFSKEFNRLCYTYNAECEGCPLENSNYSCDGYDVTQKVIDIVQKWSDEQPDIKPCPFCGKSDCVKFNWEDDGAYPQVQVICDATKDGCGSSSGFRDNEEEALELWNTRLEEV